MPRGKRPDRAHLPPMSDAEYAALLGKQGGGCAICGAKPKSRRLSRDHDHRTRRLRGLLCHRCNRVLWFGLNAEWCRKAADYLERPPAV